MAKNMLLEAAREGRVEVLEKLLEQDPSLLADFKLISLTESLLHIATKSGHLNFVCEIMKTDHNLAKELNKDGFRPLDIAVIMGNFDIVKEILRFNKDLCLLKGKDQRTALHYAAIKGRVDVIDELLNSCPDCIQDVTIHEETALHLAVENYQFDAFAALVKWLKRLGKETIINMKDGDGNTVLHVAVSTKQHAVIDLILRETRETIEVNATNANGSTALDVLDIQDSYDLKIRQKLESAGAVTCPLSTPPTAKTSKILKPKHEHPQKNWFKYFKFQMQRDSPSDTRNTLLLVAALIATVCFQAGVDPPNGIQDKPPQPNTPNQNSRAPPSFGPAGGSALAVAAAIFGSRATSYLFLFANSLGLTAATCIIIYLTSGFPFQRELHIALYSMMSTYGFAISSIMEGIDSRKKTMAYLLVTVAFILPFALRWLPRWGKRAWKYWRNRDHVRRTPLPVDSCSCISYKNLF